MSLLKCFTGKETKYQAHPIGGSYADGNGKWIQDSYSYPN